MSERLTFHFDPLCPWCYQTSRWVHRLVELGEVEATWAVFSLALANAETEEGREKAERKEHARGQAALRTVIAARDAGGPAAVGRFYASIGAAIHERGEPADDAEMIRGALKEADLDPELLDIALADESTWERVETEHRALVERTRSFGVPTIVLDGDGPAIFGPVISEVPSDADAVELYRHVAWLARYRNFSELKRDRTVMPELESVRRFMERQREEGGEPDLT